MIKLDISHIYNELNIIITNNKKYLSETILYAIAALEIVNIIEDENIIPFKFIEIMQYLKQYVNCYIDFDLITYICKTNKLVSIDLDKNNYIEKIYDRSYNIYTEIEDMLKKDNEMLNNIINEKEDNDEIDEYGKIDKNVIFISKRLFDLIDKNKMGYLTALDILRLLNINNDFILLLNDNFYNDMIYILLRDKKIDYNSFIKYLF